MLSGCAMCRPGAWQDRWSPGLAAATGQERQAADAPLGEAIVAALCARSIAAIDATLNAAVSAAVYRHLWRALGDAWRDSVVRADIRVVAHGSFAGAIHLGNDTFRGFASVAGTLPVNDCETPLVTFCTGGIRCEKAAPLLRQLGHSNVFQLSGGILRHLERVGSAHYRGACFVFDERVGLDSDLAPQKAEQL